MMERLIAYACLAISGAFAATYGYSTGDGQYASALRAGAWAMAAIVGGCTPAWALHHWDSGKYGRAIMTVILGLLCWAMTIYGSVGGFAGSADRKLAERARAIDSSESDKQELARVSGERARLQVRTPGAIEADLARTEEKSSRWWKLKGELATAKQADALDGRISALKANLFQGDAVAAADPGATALALISGRPAAEIAAWSMLLGAISLELAGMIAMMRADALPRLVGRTGVAPSIQLRQADPLEDRHVSRKMVPAVKTAVRRAVPSGTTAGTTPPQTLPKHGLGQVYGSVRKFCEQCIAEERGSRLELKAIIGHYKAWCERHSIPPASFEKFCSDIESVLQIDVDGSTVYALDVGLA